MRLFTVTITDPELRRKLGGGLFTVGGLIFLTISLFGLYQSGELMTADVMMLFLGSLCFVVGILVLKRKIKARPLK